MGIQMKRRELNKDIYGDSKLKKNLLVPMVYTELFQRYKG